MSETKTRFQPNASLTSFLLAVALIAISVAYWHNSRRMVALVPEVNRLRAEVGQLSIQDRTQFHAIAIDTGEPNTWRWRLFLPKGTRYRWNAACDDIPRFSPPAKAQAATTSNEPYWDSENEVLVDAKLRIVEGGDWILSVTSKIGDSKHQMSGTSLKIPKQKIAWMSSITSTDGQVIGSNGTAIKDPAGPIILLQRRPCEWLKDGTYQPSENPTPGFMVWLTKW